MQDGLPLPTRRTNLDSCELVELAVQRDSHAWSEIYLQHYDAIFRYLFGRLGRKEEAEDLASQVFLEALKSIGSYRDRGKPLAAWLFGIARNVSNNQFRHTGRAKVEPLDQYDLEDGDVAVPDRRAEVLDLIAGINMLTEEQRDTIILRFYTGLTAREVADVLDKSEPAVYALQIRAIAALRRRLAEEVPPSGLAAA